MSSSRFVTRVCVNNTLLGRSTAAKTQTKTLVEAYITAYDCCQKDDAETRGIISRNCNYSREIDVETRKKRAVEDKENYKSL